MIAFRIGDQSVRSTDEYLHNLTLTAALDPYEANDAKLSYVMTVYREQHTNAIPQANQFAQELLDGHSNSSPKYLVQYYLGTGQDEMAVEAAKTAARNSASDANTWNSIISLLYDAFIGSGSNSPLFGENAQAITQCTIEYYEMLCQRNRESMEEIELNFICLDFFSRMSALASSEFSQ